MNGDQQSSPPPPEAPGGNPTVAPVKPDDHPTKTELSILPRSVWIIITIAACAAIGALLWLGLKQPENFISPVSRFFACVLFSLCLSLLFFAAYPQESRLREVPYIGITVDLVGPVALFVVSLLLLLNLYPETASRYYQAAFDGPNADLDLQLLRITKVSGDCDVRPVSREADYSILDGFYVQFPDNSTACRLRIQEVLTYETELKRNSSDTTALLERVPQRRQQ